MYTQLRGTIAAIDYSLIHFQLTVKWLRAVSRKLEAVSATMCAGLCCDINISEKPRALVNHFYERPLLSFPRRINKVRFRCAVIWVRVHPADSNAAILSAVAELEREIEALVRRNKKKPKSLCHATPFCKKFQFS